MANRFPLVVTTGASNAVAELASGDNLNLTGNNIIVNTDKLLTLPTTADTLVGRDTSDTLTNKTLSQAVLFSPRIQDTTQDHRYIIGVSELAADRTVTLPLLAGNDTFVFESFQQTLTNKTLTNPTLNAGGGVLVLPQGTTPAQTAEGSIFWDTDDNLLSIGDGSARKVFVDTTSTQNLSGKTLDAVTLTGTLTAGGSAGTNGYVLKSTGTGIQWVQSSDAILITDTTNATDTVYPLMVSETTGTLVDVDILTTKFSINGPTGDVSLGSTTVGTSTTGALKVTGGIKAGNLYVAADLAPFLTEASLTQSTGSFSNNTGAFTVVYAVTAVNTLGETIGSNISSKYYNWSTNPTSYTATVTWAAISGASSYKVYRRTSTTGGGLSSWFLVETVPAANPRTHSSTFSISRSSSNPGTYYATQSGGFLQPPAYYFYISTALSPVNGTSSGSGNFPRTTNTTGITNSIESAGSIGATALRLSAASPLLNASGTALEFVPKYNISVFTGDGTSTTFSLGYSPLEYEIFVTVAGVPQTPGSSYAYYMSGNFIVFTEAPNPADRIVVRSLIMKVRGS
jgi:hypothetical protein